MVLQLSTQYKQQTQCCNKKDEKLPLNRNILTNQWYTQYTTIHKMHFHIKYQIIGSFTKRVIVIQHTIE